MKARDGLTILAVVTAVLAATAVVLYIRIRFLVDCAEALGWTRCLFHA